MGEFSDHPANARFDIVSKAARDWFAHLGRGGKAQAITLKVACANYVKHLTGAGKAHAALDNEQRFARWVDDHKIGGITLPKLKPSDIDGWRTGLAVTPTIPHGKKSKKPPRARSAGTLNRDMTSLRAALNPAVENGDATSDSAWKMKLRPLKDADHRRDVYLDLGQRRALIAKAPADLAAFLNALSLVPLRPGAMAALVAGSFDKRLSTLNIRKGKHGQDRKVTLPPATAATTYVLRHSTITET